MRIRIGLWQDVDLDKMREWMKENDYQDSDYTTDQDVIDYLHNRMSEDIDTMVKLNEVYENITYEEMS